MTRIGLAYNQKPDLSSRTGRAGADDGPPPEEEPPSRRRDAASSRTSVSPACAGAAPASPAPSDVDDYAEWDAPATIDAVATALAALGEVVRLEATDDFPERLRAERPDIVFNVAEGLRGPNRESHVPAICEFYGVPYSGSDPFTLALCLHKARTKEALAWHGIPTAPFALIESLDDLAALPRQLAPAGRAGEIARLLSRGTLRFPLFAKPVHEGSSKGITEKSLCRDRQALEAQVAFLLEAYEQPVLVEEFLPGAELTCAVLGNGGTARVLPLVGIDFGVLPDGALPVYGFEAKWVWDTPDRPLEMFACPAPIDGRLRDEIERLVLRTYRVLGCRDWSRIDVRLDAQGAPNVIEVNPLPGVLPDPKDNSCLPKAARAAGIDYDALIQICLRHAADRQGVPLPRSAPASPALAGAGTPG
jgi:D-alanine-D-alanine ligase